MNELVFRVINAIEEGLNQATPEGLGFRLEGSNGMSEEARRDALHELKQAEIDNGIVALETLLNATVDKDFDKFEIYTLRNILAVGHKEENLAPWVQLDHYKNLDLRRSDDAPTPEQVQLQRRKLQETTKLNAMLKAEEARNTAMLSRLQSVLGTHTSQFTFLTSSSYVSKNSTSEPLHQNVQYALSQLPALRQLLPQLKESLQTLPNARQAHNDENSVEGKRRQYLETQSRRALERKGIDPEDPSKAAAGVGRRIGRDEVEGMEAVVQALGGAEALSRSKDENEE